VIRAGDCFNIFRVANGKLVEDTPSVECQSRQIVEQIGGVPPE
jgi:hypothetical protein